MYFPLVLFLFFRLQEIVLAFLLGAVLVTNFLTLLSENVFIIASVVSDMESMVI